MRTGFIFLPEISLTYFAVSRIVLFHEILFTTVANLDELATSWA